MIKTFKEFLCGIEFNIALNKVDFTGIKSFWQLALYQVCAALQLLACLKNNASLDC